MSQKNPQLQLDGTDKEILRKLMKDARTPILEIARKIGISGAAIHQRLRKLEQSGLITGSKYVLDPKVLGYTTMAYIGVYLDKAMNHPEAVESLKKIPEAINISKKTISIVWQNIFFALGVKGIFILMGGFGLASMWEAVFADMGVAVIAILNAARVLKG